MQTQQESVNKAIVDVQTARDNAVTAQRDVEASQKAVNDANEAITDAQRKFDTFAAATYVNGPSGSLSDRRLARGHSSPPPRRARPWRSAREQVMTNLQRARIEQVNRESTTRLTKEKADQAAVDAQSSRTPPSRP